MIKPKSGYMQIRVEPELLARFKVVADYKSLTVSDLLRELMTMNCNGYDAHMARLAEKSRKHGK